MVQARDFRGRATNQSATIDLICCYSVSLHQHSLEDMFLKLNPTTGQPLYLQLMQQVRHAAETGALRDGDQLPGIRTLAEELVVSPNTVAKAYCELEHEGLLELRQGLGAFVCVKRRTRSLENDVNLARRRLGHYFTKYDVWLSPTTARVAEPWGKYNLGRTVRRRARSSARA